MKRILGKIARRARYAIKPPGPCALSHAFSQEGEDLVLSRALEMKPDGFYVDVGAHHPVRYSNTYLFYLRGWRGINMDAMPGSMEPFKKIRPGDINLEIAIGENPGKLKFHIFNDPALNTFDPALAAERDGKHIYKIVETRQVEIRTLAQVLGEHLPAGKAIDFLSVDVEGLDLQVLRSSDWGRFRPEYVLTEDFSCDFIEDTLKSPITLFMRSVGYDLFAKTVHTQIYKRR